MYFGEQADVITGLPEICQHPSSGNPYVTPLDFGKIRTNQVLTTNHSKPNATNHTLKMYTIQCDM
jgi:hypothetical protein